VVAAPTQTRYADSATLGVVPVSTKTDGAVAYLQDVVSRGMVVPTFVTVLNVDITPDQLIAAAGLDPNLAGRVTYQALPSRLGGAVEVTVTADDEATAERLGQAAVELSQSRVLALGSYYRLEGRMAGARPADTLPGWVWAPLAVLLAAGLAGLWLSVRSLRRRERSSADPAPRVASGARA
jgi:hypothetical protein